MYDASFGRVGQSYSVYLTVKFGLLEAKWLSWYFFYHILIYPGTWISCKVVGRFEGCLVGYMKVDTCPDTAAVRFSQSLTGCRKQGWIMLLCPPATANCPSLMHRGLNAQCELGIYVPRRKKQKRCVLFCVFVDINRCKLKTDVAS